MKNIKNKLDKGETGIYFTRSKLGVYCWKCGYSKFIKIDNTINGKVSECDEDDKLSVENLPCFK